MEHSPPILFDRTRLRKRRDRSANTIAGHDFLYQEAAAEMLESLAFINRPFPTILELGSQTDYLKSTLAERVGTSQYISCDISAKTLAAKNGNRVAADEEYLPFAAQSVDAVVSIFTLQWVNDLPGTLAQIHRILKPDGVFMAVLCGGETLRELRSIFAATETAQKGGIHPRIAPMIDVRDAGALLQRAGFALPVADSDTLTITYPNLFALMEDIRAAGQNNMLKNQLQHFTSRGFFLDAAQRYAAQHSTPKGDLIATAELITLTGWKPAASQQQPAKRGSGMISLTKALQ